MGDRERTESEIISLYSRVAPIYGRVGPPVFSYFGRRLVELTEIGSGSRVLDAGTGRGACLFPAVEKVGEHGQVIGIDLSEGMVQETANDINGRGLKNTTVIQMDAEHLAFHDATFDYVLSGFAFFWFSGAPSEFYRILRPGGKIAFNVAGPGAIDEKWQWYNDLLTEYHKKYHQFPLGPPRKPPAHPHTRDPAELKAMLAQAGFVDNRVTSEEAEFIYKDEDEWWGAKWTHGDRYPLERMEPEILDKFKSEVFTKIQLLKQPDGFHELWRILYVLGTKPYN
jgi:ubiquinone/menaquinone biosynthesis C-methylase UbiE